MVIIMVVTVSFLLMVLGIIPSTKVVQFLRKHKAIGMCVSIAVAIGIMASFAQVLLY